MRLSFFILLFFVSCSIKEKLIPDQANNLPTNSSFSKIDTNKDNKITQEELVEFKNSKEEVFNSDFDYKNPILIFTYILLTILSLCSLTYIVDLFKRIYFYLKNLITK